MKPQDTAQVMQIWLDGNVEAHDFVPRDYWTSHYDLVQKQLLQADVIVYGADKRIVGFAGMMDDYLAGIFVDKTYRSMGIGKSLLDFLKQNHSRFSLHVYQRNRRAVGFYLKEGLSIASEGVDEDTAEMEYTMIWQRAGRTPDF